MTTKMQKWILFAMTFIVAFYIDHQQTYGQAKNGELHSEAAIVMDQATGEIVYKQNDQKSMYPASITKIVTAIIAIEQANLNEKVTVSRDAVHVNGSRVYLEEGEELPLKQLIQGLMINSGNDAAIAIAEHIDGSVESFADRMNNFVEFNLGLEDTHFTNPHGLFEEDHVTTARDMAKITAYAMEDDTFRDVVSTKTLEWNAEGWETTLYNSQQLLWRYDGVNGVKNGYVRKSGYTLVTTAEKDGTEVVVVTLNSPSKAHSNQDTKQLLDESFDRFKTEWIQLPSFPHPLRLEYDMPDAYPVTKHVEEELTAHLKDNGTLIVRDVDKQIKDVAKFNENKPLILPGLYGEDLSIESWLDLRPQWWQTIVLNRIGKYRS
ncbi:D-alanyl-D-alanine carboxypeptidase family protein [Texcoconibacillus texcoconensis]|uniref:D-alanyl-D-alanine carboxypeptidase/D-alanyl-D-alanine carboxypeptidase (Penicillin-binding protein 5/6) n=1 Tax=Texcoconibacillus texcoconensis TaxID=1095777 RepID=A0A840QQM7_9BACI|nr:D-alanyl-D-alanine carboxypeptidase family protein [Texcoconibacillus texcoconensis]MBB5173660.1 D-alanyl-D-alanine carboxypeptidase/D-alanyl-D-alanine carboxypeptidase (penicillin-binding protein 5/6) [Texcoconibacillus texcoconensis]